MRHRSGRAALLTAALLLFEVRVSNGEVTLEGTVEDRRTKRMAEDIIEICPGVKQVHNRIRVQGNGGEREKVSDKSSHKSSQSSKS